MKRTLFVISLALIALFSVASAQAENPPEFVCVLSIGFNAWDIACDAAGNIYVTDDDPFDPHIYKLTSDGTFLTMWGSRGSGNGQFYHPWGVACDAAGNVYVADSSNDRIQKFASNGTFLSTWGTYGTSSGQFATPHDVACDAAGNVYVADYNNDRIQKFTSDGTFLTMWGSEGSGNGQFSYPRGVTCDAASNVYVVDWFNHRIQKFTSDGTFLTMWGSEGSGNGQFIEPIGIACDPEGNVYVTDWSNNRIQKFASDGTFLTVWGSEGSGNGQFINPLGVACDAAGNIYVVDPLNSRIQKFLYYYEPHQLTIDDVGNDQGRQIRITFTKSIRDRVNSPTPILCYEAYRQIDPLLATRVLTTEPGQDISSRQALMMRGWEYVGEIPAHGEDEYNLIVPTLADSTADDGIHWSKFFIRAVTATPTTFWDSPADSGYSIDNLAPNVPLNFNINTDGFLTWDPNLEKDLGFYTVYASNSPEFDESKFVFGRTTNTTYDARLGTTKYYYLTATDLAGNESQPATTELRPIAVLLSWFEAERKPNTVILRWQVGQPDYSLVSFDIFREENGGKLKLNAATLTGQESYCFTDDEAPREAINYWLKSLSPDEAWHGPITVAKAPALPLSVSAFPNPFNPSTTITYTVPVAGEITLSVYDVRGGLVKTLINHERKKEGQYQFSYQHQGSSGVYFVRLLTGKEIRTQKIVVLQ